MTWAPAVLTVVGVTAVAAAGFMVATPLGLLVVGVEALACAYVIRYLGVRR